MKGTSLGGVGVYSDDTPKDPLTRLEDYFSYWHFMERQFPYLAFQPMPFQRAVLEKRVKIRVLWGGNRAGKTKAAAIDLVQIATNTKHVIYPGGWPKMHGPKKIWAIFLDANKARDTGIQKIREALGSHISWKWREADQEFHLGNGSVIAIKSQESGFTKAQSADIDHAWFDEQPEERYFREVMTRLIDRNGTCTVSMTLIDGINWFYTSYIEPHLEETNGLWTEHNGILCASQAMTENRHIDKQAVADYIKTICDPQELLIRVKGQAVYKQGLIFPNFDPRRHIFNCMDAEGRCQFKPPVEWRKVRTQDWGLKAPAACVWMARDPGAGVIHWYREFYRTEQPIKEICKQVLLMSPKEEKYEADLLDAACWQRTPQQNGGIGDFITFAHLYQQYGIPVMKASKDLTARIQLMRVLLGNPEETPGLLIHACCRNSIREVRRWQYHGLTQRPEDKNDHAIDAGTGGLAYFESEAGTSGKEWAEVSDGNTYVDEPMGLPADSIVRGEAFEKTDDFGNVTIHQRLLRRGRSEWESDEFEYDKDKP